MTPATVAIVGAGFSGTLVALHLLRCSPPWARVALLERNARFGRGQAYGTANASHLLNVAAGRMSAFHDRPDHFIAWLRDRHDSADRCPQADTFVPRREFGAYIRHLLNEELSRPGLGDRLDLIRGEVLDIDVGDRPMRLVLDRDRTLDADMVVLALGNFPPEPPPVETPEFYDSRYYRPDPWAPDALSGLCPDDPVLLIGTGLTTVDAVVALLDAGHTAPIHAVSRRGLLPHRHGAHAGARPADPIAYPTSITALSRLLRRETGANLAAGGDWHPTVDAMRPFTTDVWQGMSLDDRRRFLRHLRPWWEIHRHRIAPAVAERIHAARASGQLVVRAGRMRAFHIEDHNVRVTFRPRGPADRLDELRVTRVINCAGPGADYDRIAHPLARALLRRGVVRPDPLRLGLDVTAACATIDGAGAISRRLFAVGPVTKGRFWEMTAVPDIRRQCEVLAGHLASLARPPVQQEPAIAGASTPAT